MTIPFLADFQPYSLNGTTASSIDDMVSINLQQLVEQTDIIHELGSTQVFSIPVSIKNITNNAQLKVTLTFDKSIFIASLPDEFFLDPEETKTFSISSNVDGLNALSVNNTVMTDFNIRVESILNGTVVTKNSNTTALVRTLLDKTITKSV